MTGHWNRPRDCLSFWHWAAYGWNFPCGFKGPYIQLRHKGFRLLGFTVEWTTELKGKD